ncbi:MAG: hypothetical protein AAF432_15705 [Planctomycetota bacterium]
MMRRRIHPVWFLVALMVLAPCTYGVRPSCPCTSGHQASAMTIEDAPSCCANCATTSADEAPEHQDESTPDDCDCPLPCCASPVSAACTLPGGHGIVFVNQRSGIMPNHVPGLTPRDFGIRLLRPPQA